MHAYKFNNELHKYVLALYNSEHTALTYDFKKAITLSKMYTTLVMYVDVGDNRPFLEKIPFSFVSYFWWPFLTN